MTGSLRQAAEAAAEKYALEKAIHLWERLPTHGPAGDYKEKPVRGSHSDIATYLAGWSAAIAHLEQAAGLWNKEAATEQAKHEDSDGYFGFLAGAEWQHSQDRARIGLAERTLEEIEALKQIEKEDAE